MFGHIKKINNQQWLFLATFMLVACLTLFPAIYLIYNSFSSAQTGYWTLNNYIRIFTSPHNLELIRNTALFSLGSALFASGVGITLAFISERADTPLKSFFFALALIPLVVPEILFTISWIFLLSPKIGLITQLFMTTLGLEQAPFNIYSLGGMIWIEGLSNSPLAFLMMKGIYSSFNATFEEAALTCGASHWQTFRHITLRITGPAVFSAFMLILIKGFTEFDVPAIIGLAAGVKVFTSEIYLALRSYPNDYGLAGAYSVILMLIATLGVFLNSKMVKEQARFFSITGKDYRSKKINIGSWRYPAAVTMMIYLSATVLLPFLILLWSSFQPFYQPPSLAALAQFTFGNYISVFLYPNITGSITLTLFLAVLNSCLVLFLAAIISWFSVKTALPCRFLLDNVSFLPVVFPGLVLGAAIMFLYLNLPLPVYGTIWLLLIGYITHNLPYGIRYTSPAMLQIHRELEEAAFICGATWWQQFTQITLPLLKAGLTGGLLYLIIISVRQLSIPLLLYSPGQEVLAVTIWELWSNGNYPILSALGSMMITLLILLTIAAEKLKKRD